MTNGPSGKQLPQNLAFRMETLGRHVELGACPRSLIAEARRGKIGTEGRRIRIGPLTDESGDQEIVRIDMA